MKLKFGKKVFTTSAGTLVLHDVRLTDAKLLNEIVNEDCVNQFILFPKPISLQSTRERIAKAGKKIVWILAELDGSIAGSADLTPYLGRSSHVANFGIAISQKFQGKGIGKTLLKSLFSFAKKNGIEIISASAFADNKKALAFYKHLGFKKAGILEKHLKRNGKYLDLILITKEL